MKEVKSKDPVKPAVRPINPVIHHGQQKHGTKEFNEDIEEGVHSKDRDLKSPQIRGNDSKKIEPSDSE